MPAPTVPPRRSNGNNSGDDSDEQGGHNNGDHHSNPPDASSALVELQSDEFPYYFSERDGRLYHSSSSPYPLPVDTPEQERHRLLHNILHQFLGAHYVGPVPEILAFDQGRRKMTLDVCTGTGIWAMEMAREFPWVHFRGFDIVPIATRYPSNNVQFELDDVNTQYRWDNGTFDVVHARDITLAVRDYHAVLDEVARVLRPGGLFVSCEWDPYTAFDPASNRNLAMHAPACCRFFDAVNDALDSCRGLRPIPELITSILESKGCFTAISPRKLYIPIGAWRADPALRTIGVDCRRAHQRYADSIKPLLIEAGWTQNGLDRLVGEYMREMDSLNGLVAVVHTVHARKI
ncbi:unnamed protein product [Cyclocybe aegerita]|uniref:S-adenosyl-L-methionine-dependent methyltransferase n=1 Tax=Cyclocybe aegerita TaxID=1973307 RepID=A0A8S0W4F6_CYCAE|nr:unnamed protein product [Cyclocybe aegerita]